MRDSARSLCGLFMIRGKTTTMCKPQGEPSESKAMGLYLEAEHEPQRCSEGQRVISIV